MTRELAAILRRYLAEHGPDPEISLLVEALTARLGYPPTAKPTEAWQEALLDLLAEKVVEGWDRYGAPSAALTPSRTYVASFEGPGGGFSVEAPTKREAYRLARREWVKRLLK